jgi:hypothetical protein
MTWRRRHVIIASLFDRAASCGNCPQLFERLQKWSRRRGIAVLLVCNDRQLDLAMNGG